MKFNGHRYEYTSNFGYPHHRWELRSAHGAVHFHVTLVPNHTTTAGLELHRIYPLGDDAPDHVNCPLTGGRCWHDGTSLYATETLWPVIEPLLREGRHEDIFRLLEHEAKRLAPTPESDYE